MDVDVNATRTGADAARPRAFFPDYADRAPRRAATPGWDLRTERRLDDGRTIARGMGWFSIGLGLVELLAPRRVTAFLGVPDEHASLVRLYGAREIASGMGILSERTPRAGVWSRVAGDALDLATLVTFTRDSARTSRILAAMGMVAGAMALDLTSARQLTRTRAAGWRGAHA